MRKLQPFKFRLDIRAYTYTAPNWFPFPSDFPSFSAPVRATCSTDIIVLHFVNTIMSGGSRANMGPRMSYWCGYMCPVKTWEMSHLLSNPNSNLPVGGPGCAVCWKHRVEQMRVGWEVSIRRHIKGIIWQGSKPRQKIWTFSMVKLGSRANNTPPQKKRKTCLETQRNISDTWVVIQREAKATVKGSWSQRRRGSGRDGRQITKYPITQLRPMSLIRYSQTT